MLDDELKKTIDLLCSHASRGCGQSYEIFIEHFCASVDTAAETLTEPEKTRFLGLWGILTLKGLYLCLF